MSATELLILLGVPPLGVHNQNTVSDNDDFQPPYMNRCLLLTTVDSSIVAAHVRHWSPSHTTVCFTRVHDPYYLLFSREPLHIVVA